MLNYFIAIWNSCYQFITTYCAKEYQLKLESYQYVSKSSSYTLVFRIRTKQIIQRFEVHTLFFNLDIIDLMHPVDAYIVGIIYGMYRNKVQVDTNIINYFCGYDSYKVVPPHLYVDSQYMDESADYIILRTKTGKKLFKVTILELCQKSFLLHAIGSRESAKLGFFSSEKFILEVN